jgi:hypothetical protein
MLSTVMTHPMAGVILLTVGTELYSFAHIVSTAASTWLKVVDLFSGEKFIPVEI